MVMRETCVQIIQEENVYGMELVEGTGNMYDNKARGGGEPYTRRIEKRTVPIAALLAIICQSDTSDTISLASAW